MQKFMAIFDLFRKGSSVLDPALWKQRQITATVLATVIMAVINVAANFGMQVPVDTETATAISAGVIAAVNVVLTITTTDKVGLNVVSDAKPNTETDIGTSTDFSNP